LHQEFHELEILDEITNIQYLGKLNGRIVGDTGNTLIHAFRKWKGMNYVPAVVHSALRWSKHDPFIENKVDDTATPNLFSEIQAKEPIKNEKTYPIGVKRKDIPSSSIKTKTTKKPKLTVKPGSNNSCAYDLIFTAFFSIWEADQIQWKQCFHDMGNDYMKSLTEGFALYEKNTSTLEEI
ncbi:hypothetical protein CPB84DRAFT_1693972, partial [Gymnopilus junonius]